MGTLQSGIPARLDPIEIDRWTFRDPAGQLRLTADFALRRVRRASAEQALEFLASDLRQTCERSGDLIPTQVASLGAHPSIDPDDLWLQHPRIDPISYPWEWTVAQWRAAAELTLRIADLAIDQGWTLKDATPLNILFVGARPVLVDTLSFERRDPASKVWLAYGQFVRTFLLPLAAEKFLHWPLRNTLFSRDGYEPRSIYNALDLWQKLNPNLLDVVTLAALFENSNGGNGKGQASPSKADPELVAHILHKRIARLGRQIRSCSSSERHTQWSGYQQAASHYSSADTDRKRAFIKNVLERCHPSRVLDIGANAGAYSVIAAESGAKVVALDSDEGAVQSLWRTAEEKRLDITAMVANIARPTPAAGWRNQEQLSLLERLAEKFDLVLMLAVIHHLILQEQIPLGHIAVLCASLSRQWLVIEWVPPSDSMFQSWLRGRDELYGYLSETDLKSSFAPWFQIAERMELENGRVLFLFERNQLLDRNEGTSLA